MRRFVRVIATVAMSGALLCALTGTAFAYTCSYAPIAGAGPSPMTITLAGAGENVIVSTDASGQLLVNNQVPIAPCAGVFAIKTDISNAANNKTATGIVINGGAGPDNVTIDFSVGHGLWATTNAPAPAAATFPIMGRNIELDGTSELELKTSLGIGPNTVKMIGTGIADTLTFGQLGGAWTTENESDTNKSFGAGDAADLPDWSYSGLQGLTIDGGWRQ